MVQLMIKPSDVFSGEVALQQVTKDLRPFLCIILHNGTFRFHHGLLASHPTPSHPGFHLQWAGPGLVSLGPSGCVLPETDRQRLG